MGPGGARLGGRPIEALLLDYGLTLVSFARPTEALLRAHQEIAVRLRAAAVGPVPPAATLLAEVHDRVEDAVARHEASGALTEIDAVAEERRAYAALGLRLPDELFDEVAALAQRAWWEGVRLPAATAGTLRELRRRGLRLGLCSNAPYRPRSLRGQLAHLGLTGLLDSVTLSSEVGRRKPAPEIFAAALSALGVEAGRSAMVGDRRREDVVGARSAGLATIRVREHRDDPGPDDADAVIDTLPELVELLFPSHGGRNRGSVVGDDTSG
jgi:putative hydrolase of the HAD superfamily